MELTPCLLVFVSRELLWTLSRNELWLLEKALSSSEGSSVLTDKAFELQLNELNRLKQHDKQIQYPHRHGNALTETHELSGYVSHSPSTLTIVTHSNAEDNSTEICSHGDDDTEICNDGDDDTEICNHGDDDTEICNHGDDDTEICNDGDDDTEICNHGDDDTETCTHGDDDAEICSHGDDDTEICNHGDDDTETCTHGDDDTEICNHGDDDTEICSHDDDDTEICSHGICHGICDTASDNHIDCDIGACSHGNQDTDSGCHDDCDRHCEQDTAACSYRDTGAGSHGSRVCKRHGHDAEAVEDPDHHGSKLCCHDTRTCSHSDKEADTAVRCTDRAERTVQVPHQVSSDSGNLSDHVTSPDNTVVTRTTRCRASDHVTSPDNTVVTRTTRCRASRLRKSQSWPPHSQTRPGRCQRHSICADSCEYMSSLELMQCCHLAESGENITYTQSMGSREFQFNLPRNTSRQHSRNDDSRNRSRTNSRTDESNTAIHQNSTTDDSGSTSEVNEESSGLVAVAKGAVNSDEPDSKVIEPHTVSSDGEESPDKRVFSTDSETSSATRGDSERIIYTENGVEDLSDRAPGEDGPRSQIAFVTGALNDFFYTDPTFQGVTPPINSSTSCGKSRGKSSLGRRRNHKAKRSASSNSCPMCNRQDNIPTTNQTVHSTRNMAQAELCTRHKKSSKDGRTIHCSSSSSSCSLDYEWDRER